jgi:hypothetical protein
MADYDLSTITGALSQTLRPQIVRTFNATSVALKTLPIVRGSGKNCAWDIEDAGAIGENFSDGADVSNFGSDIPHLAKLDWGLYRSNFKVTNLARSVAASSHSPDLQPIARNIINSARKLAATINDELFDGLGTGTLIAGLDVALDDDNTYAGLNRSTETYVRSNVFDPGASHTPTLAQLRKDLHDIKDVCGEMPSMAFLKSSSFLSIAGQLDNTRQYTQDVTINTPRGQVTLDASVGKFMVEGCLFISDKDATAGSIYYVNPEYVEIQYLPSADEGPLTEDVMRMGIEDGYGAVPLGMNVYPLARTGAARKVTAEVQVQLVVRKPSACGIRLNVA